MAAALVFKKPRYIKYETGLPIEIVPAYIFEIEGDPESTVFRTITTCPGLPSIQHIITNEFLKEHSEKWTKLISTFIQFSAQYFTKPATQETLSGRFIHKVSIENINNICDGELYTNIPVLVIAIPRNIIVERGKFILEWHCTISPALIDISLPEIEQPPAFPDSSGIPAASAVSSSVNNYEIESFNLDDLPADIISSDNTAAPMTLLRANTSSPSDEITASKLYEQNKCKEAKMKAKLAQYKAERVFFQYMTKYGSCPDADNSENESDIDSKSDNGSNIE